MTSKEFVIWLKGFTEACNDFTATPKQWDRIKEVLNEVEDYDDYQDIDEEIDDWYPAHNNLLYPNGTISRHINAITFTSGSSNTSITNYPNGSPNITYTNKQQLND